MTLFLFLSIAIRREDRILSWKSNAVDAIAEVTRTSMLSEQPSEKTKASIRFLAVIFTLKKYAKVVVMQRRPHKKMPCKSHDRQVFYSWRERRTHTD